MTLLFFTCSFYLIRNANDISGIHDHNQNHGRILGTCGNPSRTGSRIPDIFFHIRSCILGTYGLYGCRRNHNYSLTLLLPPIT